MDEQRQAKQQWGRRPAKSVAGPAAKSAAGPAAKSAAAPPAAAPAAPTAGPAAPSGPTATAATAAPTAPTAPLAASSQAGPTAEAPKRPGADVLCPAVRKMGYSASGLQLVGQGAFSRVYRARSSRVAGRDIAVKIVRLDDPNISQAWKEHSMKRELKILKRVKHPNVVAVFDVVKTRSRIYIFMELAAASVASHLEATGEPASEQTARNWFGGIAGAVAYLHRTEIAHRDLKNDNILIDSNGRTKLTDFGFACFTYDKKAGASLQASTSCGTKAYVAPEVFDPPYSAKLADVWSLGVCLYESLTLQLPFAEELPTQLYVKRQLERGLVIPRNFEDSLHGLLQDLLRRMIEPDVARRASSEAVTQHPWMKLPP